MAFPLIFWWEPVHNGDTSDYIVLAERRKFQPKFRNLPPRLEPEKKRRIRQKLQPRYGFRYQTVRQTLHQGYGKRCF